MKRGLWIPQYGIVSAVVPHDDLALLVVESNAVAVIHVCLENRLLRSPDLVRL